jgi:thermostable 8-oxoguanine DNA glycosylase
MGIMKIRIISWNSISHLLRCIRERRMIVLDRVIIIWRRSRRRKVGENPVGPRLNG